MLFLGYLCAFLYGAACLALGFVASRLGCPQPYTRKIVHITVGFEWFILHHFFGTSIHFFVVCLAFSAMLAFVYLKKQLPMIGSDGDNAPGTVYYGVSMTVLSVIALFAPDYAIPFGIGVCCTSLGDGFAGVIGQAFPNNPKLCGSKSLLGTLSGFLVSALATYGMILLFDLPLTWLHALAIGLFSAEVELLCTHGLDNILVPLSTSWLTYGFLTSDAVLHVLIPILLTPAVIVYARSRRALTRDGLIAALLADAAMSIALGNLGFVLLLSFFAIGTLSDKVRKAKKTAILADVEQKGDCRDCLQVFANAGVSMIAAFLFSLTAHPVFLLAVIASLAEALGDTLASGIGVLSTRTFDLFRMRPCTPGVSGGMSLLGTLSAALGCAILTGIAWAWLGFSAFIALLIFVSAFLGTVFDSMLGSLAQLKYRCRVCGKHTERRVHCNTATQRIGGIRPMDNDCVNLLSTAFSAILVAVLFFIFL